MKFFMDFSSVPDPDAEPVEPDSKPTELPLLAQGWWTADIMNVEYKVSPVTDDSYLKIELSFPNEPASRREHLIIGLGERETWRLKQFLKKVYGISPSGMVQIDTDKWAGTRLSVKVKHVGYNEQTRVHISDFSHADKPYE